MGLCVESQPSHAVDRAHREDEHPELAMTPLLHLAIGFVPEQERVLANGDSVVVHDAVPNTELVHTREAASYAAFGIALMS